MYLTSCREKLLKIKKKKAAVKTEAVRKPSVVRQRRRRLRPNPVLPKRLVEIEARDFEPVA